MRNLSQSKSLTAFYVPIAAAITGFGISARSLPVLAIGIPAFAISLARATAWWDRTTVTLGRGGVICGWCMVAILVGVQLYGLISGDFGVSPPLISLLVLMLLTTFDSMYILKNSLQKAREQ